MERFLTTLHNFQLQFITSHMISWGKVSGRPSTSSKKSSWACDFDAAERLHSLHSTLWAYLIYLHRYLSIRIQRSDLIFQLGRETSTQISRIEGVDIIGWLVVCWTQTKNIRSLRERTQTRRSADWQYERNSEQEIVHLDWCGYWYKNCREQYKENTHLLGPFWLSD